jgi:DegV family protein with EDD domain
MQVAVVTDSASELDPADLEGLDITVVSLAQDESGPFDPLDIGRRPPGAIAGQGGATLVSPVDGLTGRFIDAYEDLSQRVDAILSIHVSGRLSAAFDAARAARERLRGLVAVEVVDSELASIALGFVARRVARAARQGAPLSDLTLLARQAQKNVHAMFFAESVDYLNKDAGWRRARAWPISGNGTRPLLAVEDGELRPLERVRTRARGYDRLAEFVELFPHIDQMAILHDAPVNDFELFMRRIDPLYPREQIHIGHYGPALRAELGPRAIGVFVDQGIGYD